MSCFQQLGESCAYRTMQTLVQLHHQAVVPQEPGCMLKLLKAMTEPRGCPHTLVASLHSWL